MLYFITSLIAVLGVCWIHPRLVAIALDKNIVDNPDARKLQRKPVPVLGGIAVFFGTVIGLGCAGIACDCSDLFIVVVAMMIMLYTGTLDDILDLSPALRFLVEIGTVLLLVFVGGYTLDDFHGLWGLGQIPREVAIPLTVFAAVGIINAINLIDGIDGLATGVTMPVMLFFTAVACFWGQLELGIFSAGLFGGLCGFLIYNFHPAKVFMGDTGSLFLGGAVCGLAFALDIPLVLILVGIIYILETLSDILQVGYFKLTHGKRIFRMAPLHHHLELGGWSEVKLFCVFSGVTLLACVLAFLGVMGR